MHFSRMVLNFEAKSLKQIIALRGPADNFDFCLYEQKSSGNMYLTKAILISPSVRSSSHYTISLNVKDLMSSHHVQFQSFSSSFASMINA